MCLFCVEIAKGKMTPREIASAYVENIVEEDHVSEMMVAITKEYGSDGAREISEELSKIYKERDDEV